MAMSPSSQINLREGLLETRWPRQKFLQEWEDQMWGAGLLYFFAHVGMCSRQVVAL